MTGLFIIGIILIIAAYDVFVKIRYGADATISRVLAQLNGWWPLLGYLFSFAMGCLVGHFFLLNCD